MDSSESDMQNQTVLSNIIMGYIDIDKIPESTAIQLIDVLGEA
jgi:hypothetical protein